MARVDLASELIDEIVLHEHLVPCADEVHRDVIGDLQVTVHSEETLERAVDGVMEGDGIETVIGCVSQEELVVLGRHIRGCEETGRLLRRSSTTTTAKISEKKKTRKCKGTASQVQRSKRVATSDFTGDEEIFLPEFGGAISNARSPYRGSVKGDLSGLIDSNGIKIEGFQGQT